MRSAKICLWANGKSMWRFHSRYSLKIDHGYRAAEITRRNDPGFNFLRSTVTTSTPGAISRSTLVRTTICASNDIERYSNTRRDRYWSFFVPQLAITTRTFVFAVSFSDMVSGLRTRFSFLTALPSAIDTPALSPFISFNFLFYESISRRAGLALDTAQ